MPKSATILKSVEAVKFRGKKNTIVMNNIIEKME
jgi:hypothetical protein